LSRLVTERSFVRMKLNCEGAEAEILETMLRNNLVWMLSRSLLDFDADRMDCLRPRARAIRIALAKLSIPFFEPKDRHYGMVMNFGGVRSYLLAAGSSKDNFRSKFLSVIYNARMLTKSDFNGYHKKVLIFAFPFLAPISKSREQG
jgi:hypothetical protein